MIISERTRSISPSKTLEISEKANLLKKQGHSVIDFGIGEPDFDTPEHIKEAGIMAIKNGFTKYSPNAGYFDLIGSIQNKFKRENRLYYEPKQIFVSCGAKHTLHNLMQTILNPGDEVLVLSPYWLSYPEQIKLAGAIPIFVESKKDQIDFTNLQNKLTDKTKLLLLNSPNNPTGAVIEKNSLKELAEFCVRHNILVLSDEIYEKFVYEKEHTSIASLGDEINSLTITVNGVSKSYAMTGWRIGYCAGPEEIIKAAVNLQSHTTSAPASISQKAAVAALESQQEFFKEKIKEYREKRDIVLDYLNAIKDIEYTKPEGAFYVFPDISKLFNSQMNSSTIFAEQLLERAKVALVPGNAFGDGKKIRISYATSIENVEEGMKRIKEFISISEMK